MSNRNDMFTFMAILAFVAAILVFSGMVGGSLDAESLWWLVVLFLAVGIGLTGAAIQAGYRPSDGAIVPAQEPGSGASGGLTVPGTEVTAAAQSAPAAPEATTPEPPAVSEVPAEQRPATDEEQRPTADETALETDAEREAAAATGTVVDESAVAAQAVQPGELEAAPPTTPEEEEAEAVVMEEGADAPDEPVEVPAADEPSDPDDLTQLEGIGPKMSEALINQGVTTFQKLSEMDLDEIRAVLDTAGQRFAPSAESWAEQASYAAKGDWDGLQALQDRLVAGRYPTDE